MYAMQPKKMLVMNLLEILRKYTDFYHRLNQKALMEKLDSDYGMKVERKAIKRNLMNLVDAGYAIEYSDRTPLSEEEGGGFIPAGWYLEREFDDSELRLLVDSLLFSKHIPYSQCKELIEKIEGLSNKYFKYKVRHICNLPTDMPENKQLFLTIATLDEAISKNRQVEFNYGDYGTDKQLHLRLDSEGKPILYPVSPYQMVANNGRYYLIANHSNHDNISHYRVDRIKEIRIKETPARDQRTVKDLKYGLDLPKHMAEHIYMFAGESVRVIMRAKKYIVGEIIDWFGKDAQFSNETEDEVLAYVTVNKKAMEFWALQHAPHVTVLEPQSLADRVKGILVEAANRYQNQNN